jgi:hypothetical protein
MRVAPVDNFRKLWGRIEDTITKGDYTVTIYNSSFLSNNLINLDYNVSKFEGSKSLVLSNTNFFGGKNFFLAYFYLFLGLLSIVFGGFFVFKKKDINMKMKYLK